MKASAEEFVTVQNITEQNYIKYMSTSDVIKSYEILSLLRNNFQGKMFSWDS